MTNFNNPTQQNLEKIGMVNSAIHGGGNVNNKKNGKYNHIEFEATPIEFPESSIKCTNMTISHLCKLINDPLKEVINGFEGTIPKVIFENNNRVKFLLGICIKLNKDGKLLKEDNNKLNIIKNIYDNKHNDDDTENEILNRYKSVFNKNKANKFVLSKDGKGLLSHFVKDLNNISISENRLNDGSIRINIYGLNMEKFLPYIYGKKSKELGKLEYTMTLTPHSDKNIIYKTTNVDAAKIVTITQYNEKELIYIEEKISTYLNRNSEDYYIIK